MELSNLNLGVAAESGYDLVLQHPITGDDLDGVVRVRGDKSKTVQVFSRKRVNELQKRERMQKGKGKDTDLSIEELEQMHIESGIARVISWKNIKKDGEDLPFTKENAESVFKDYPWVLEQVLDASSNLNLFRLD